MRTWWRSVSATAALLGSAVACGKLAPDADDDVPDVRADAAPVSSPAADAHAPPPRDASADPPAVDAAAPPQADGICSQTAMSAGTFDADCVYLLGTLSMSADAWRDALIHVDRPNDFATGFGYVSRAPIVRPTDGRLLFAASGDQLPDRIYRYTTPGTGFPNPSLAAQAIEPGVSCGTARLDRFFVFPDDGALLYRCGAQVFVTGSAVPLDLGNRNLLATGRNRLIVAASTYPDLVLVQNGVVTPVPGLTGTPLAFRSRPSGTMYMAISGVGVRGELREIALDGSSQVVGTYQLGAGPSGPGADCALEPSGALVCINTIDRADFAQGVVRVSFDKPPEILYDERKGGVKIHISRMVTGP